MSDNQKRIRAKVAGRAKRKLRIRAKISGTSEQPRLSIFRSNSNIYVQLIDDSTGRTLVSASTLDEAFKGKSTKAVAAAEYVGAAIGKLATAKGIQRCVFDRNGYIYHGRVKALADKAREAGLKF